MTGVQTCALPIYLLWREGRLGFERTTLAEAAQEFERYNAMPITFAESSIGEKRVTGLFSATDPIGFAKAIALSMDLKAEVRADSIILSQS
mgnify:CR=1 FL=1